MNFNIDYNSIVKSLSASLQSAVTAFNDPSFLSTQQQLLSNLAATQAFTLSSIDEVVNALSSIPLHPYQKLLHDYFGPDYTFKTIDEVPEPEVIPAEECVNYIQSKTRHLHTTSLHNLTCEPHLQIRSAFGYLSGDTVVYDIEKQKNYLEFFEMVRRIDPSTLTTDNVQSISKKIIGEYLKVI